MLTKKQMFRKSLRVRSYDTLYATEKIKFHFKDFLSMGKLWNTNDNMSHDNTCSETDSVSYESDIPSVNQDSKIEKIVSFNQLVDIVIIPSRYDLELETKQDLWWYSREIEIFKLDACCELEKFMKYKDCDLKKALTLLYQP